MIVIDNFIDDKELLTYFNNGLNKSDFFHLVYDHQEFGYEGTWWKGWWEQEAKNIHEKLIQYVFWKYKFIKTYMPIEGFEYWTNLHSYKNTQYLNGKKFRVEDFLGWHTNKDEHIYDTQDKIVTPMLSMIMWPFQHEVEGGYLEITKIREEDLKKDGHDEFRCSSCDKSYKVDEIERIEPISNRIAIFDGAYLHRVSPIIKGSRWTFAVDVWDKRTSMTGRGVY